MSEFGPFECYRDPQRAAEIISDLVNALKPFANITEYSPLGDGEIDRIEIEVSMKDINAARAAINSFAGPQSKPQEGGTS